MNQNKRYKTLSSNNYAQVPDLIVLAGPEMDVRKVRSADLHVQYSSHKCRSMDIIHTVCEDLCRAEWGYLRSAASVLGPTTDTILCKKLAGGARR